MRPWRPARPWRPRDGTSRWLSVYVAVVLLFLHLPLLILMAFSFNASRFSVEWTGFTLARFRGVADRPDILSGLRNSLVVGVTSTVVSTILGTMLALALTRYRFRGRRADEHDERGDEGERDAAHESHRTDGVRFVHDRTDSHVLAVGPGRER